MPCNSDSPTTWLAILSSSSVGGGTTRTIYNYAQREMPAFVNFLHLIARAAEKPLNTVAVPSHLLQLHTDLPWHDWS